MGSDGATNNNNHSAEEMSFRLIRNDDRFFSRLIAKEETSTPNSSSRIFYYGETSVAVPFMWEAQPGTPKHPLSETSLPPLTPPPSYFSTSKSNNANKRTNSKANKISSILARFAPSRIKSHVSPQSSWSPTSSSSSSSSWSLAYYSSPSVSNMRDRDQGEHGNLSFSSSISSMKYKCSSGFRGCYPFGNMRNKTVSYGAD